MAHLFHQASWKKLTFLSVSLASIMMLSACSKQQESTTLNIGYQKYGLLPIIKARGDLDKALKEKGVTVKWVEFPAGPQLLEGLNVGSVAFGEAGEAPPIFAQAANANLVYVANQPPAPLAEAIIVPKDSAIKSIQDLKGKKVVLNKGSNVHYLLLKVLEANHLTLKDIEVIYLPPADARAAFEKGIVGAWVIWDPFLAAAEKQLGAKVIATGQGPNGQKLVSNHQFYLSDRKFAEQHPDILKAVVNELNTTTLGELVAFIENDHHQQKGEIVLVIGGASEEKDLEQEKLDKLLLRLLEDLSVKAASQLAADLTGIKKKVAYQRALELTDKI